MGEMTPSALLKHIRATGGEAALKNLAPIGLSITMAPGRSTADEDWMYSPSMTVSPVVHPTLAALMDYHHATRRGRATWQVGFGDDTPQGAIGALLDAAAPGTVWWKSSLANRSGPKDLTSSHTNQDYHAWARATGRWPLRAQITDARSRRHSYHQVYRNGNTGAARFGVVALSDSGNSLWISFHTTQFLTLPEDLISEIGDVHLDIWQAGKAFKDPNLVYPAQALAIAEWADREGLIVWDGENTGALMKYREAAVTTVTAWPRRGRPAQATIAVGAAAPQQLRDAVRAPRLLPGRTAQMLNTDSVSLANALNLSGDPGRLVHPAVLDTAAMASAKPVVDDLLRDYQQEAVGRHLATSIGYVNASSPGLGKTIMVLDAMRRRAATIPGYRGLVVAEANVRQQWCQEAQIWFPGATVVRVESRADTPELVRALAEAGPFPVLVVTSYALATDVMNHVSDTGEVDLVEGDGEPDPETLEADAPGTGADADRDTPGDARGGSAETGPEPTLSVDLPAPDEEPEDLLQMLALILAEETDDTTPALAQTGDGGSGTEPLGVVLVSQFWHDIIADEAVTLRNTGSKQTRALWKLRETSQVAVALTGTPVSKSINDLGSLIAWTRGDRRLFHGVSLENQFDLSDDRQLTDFTNALGPILFRRDKSEIVDEIPAVESMVMPLEPTAAERALANAARNELKRAYDELVEWLAAVAAEHEDSAEYEAAKQALAEARHAWLGGTTLARMAASDPAALLTAKGSGAALLASQGLVAAATAQPGTKRTAVVADAVDRVARGERLLIFTEFATVARGLVDDLDAAGLRVGEVLGGGGAKRDRHIAAFRDGELDVLVLTSAGERGLNLQTATTLIHYDLPWTPQGIIQRAGRVERIGATAENIKVVFPVMAGTIEERVASVVVARAATMMRALDSSRGVDARNSDVGRALGSLANSAKDSEVNDKEAALLSITRELLAA